MSKCSCGCAIGKCQCKQGCGCGCNHAKGGAKWAQAESFSAEHECRMVMCDDCVGEYCPECAKEVNEDGISGLHTRVEFEDGVYYCRWASPKVRDADGNLIKRLSPKMDEYWKGAESFEVGAEEFGVESDDIPECCEGEMEFLGATADGDAVWVCPDCNSQQIFDMTEEGKLCPRCTEPMDECVCAELYDAESDDIIDCSICLKPIELHPKDTRMKEMEEMGYRGWTYGNNAQPINDGRCCDTCDCLIVIPARMGLAGANAIELGQRMLEMRINPPSFGAESFGDEGYCSECGEEADCEGMDCGKCQSCCDLLSGPNAEYCFGFDAEGDKKDEKDEKARIQRQRKKDSKQRTLQRNRARRRKMTRGVGAVPTLGAETVPPKGPPYVFPKKKSYPMNNLYHAKKALAYAQWPNNRSSLPEVKRKVFARYPQLRSWWNEHHPRNRVKVAERGRVKVAAAESFGADGDVMSDARYGMGVTLGVMGAMILSGIGMSLGGSFTKQE